MNYVPATSPIQTCRSVEASWVHLQYSESPRDKVGNLPTVQERPSPQGQSTKAIPPKRAAKRNQPPQQARRFGKQTFPIGCRSNRFVSAATNCVFCSYIDRYEIVPNSTFNPHPKMGQVNMFNKNEIMKFEQHGKKSYFSNRFDHHVFRGIHHEKQINNKCNERQLCLTIAFHLDLANAKQGEQRSLARRLPRGENYLLHEIKDMHKMKTTFELITRYKES